MFEKLLKQWANEQGFDRWSQDHAAVLRNLSKWLSIHVVDSTLRAESDECPVCHGEKGAFLDGHWIECIACYGNC